MDSEGWHSCSPRYPAAASWAKFSAKQPLSERGLPPPVTVRFSTNDRAARVFVNNHPLSTYDHLHRQQDPDDNQEK